MKFSNLYKIKFHLLLILFIPAFCYSQTLEQNFLRDTSYTIYSAWKKIKKNFPEAKTVKPFKEKGFTSQFNRVYQTIGNRQLHMDIFTPEKSLGKLTPGIILIHGGGWRSGDKSHMVPLAQKLAMAGYVTAAVEYRLSAEALYPAGIYDLKEAVRFLKAHAQEYNLDTVKIASLGCSAGATLATFLGTTGNVKKFDPPQSKFPKISTQIAAIINIDGIVDFTDPAESGKDNDPEKPSAGAWWFGGTYKEIPEKWIEASPVNYVDKKTPPTLFINSTQPRYHAGRDEYIDKLSHYGTYSEVHTIPGTNHTFWLFDPWFEETEKIVREFLLKTLINIY